VANREDSENNAQVARKKEPSRDAREKVDTSASPTADLFPDGNDPGDEAASALPVINGNTSESPSAKSPEKDEEPKEVPSLYSGPDPEFNRPIFHRHKETPPARPAGSIIRRSLTPSPSTGKPRIPRKSEVIVNLSPLSMQKVETGIQALDIRTGGFAPGTLNSLAGADAVARTHLVEGIAQNVVQKGGRVLALISPTEEAYWTPRPNLMVDVAVRRKLDTVTEAIEGAGKLDLVILDPIHSVETPPDQERVAALDLAVAKLLNTIQRKRATLFSVAHMVDRGQLHGGVSIHPWMFREVSCLMDLSDLMLMLRSREASRKEILVFRRGVNNRIGGLPSFVLPWS